MDGDLDVSRAIYLVLYLFILIMGIGGVASTVRRKPPPPRCKACETPVDATATPRGLWGGWTCANCGASVDPVEPPPSRTGLRGWMDAFPWAVHGAVWGLVIWGLLAGRDLWLGEPVPGLLTLPLAVIGGLGIGWLLTLMQGRRS